MRRTTIRSVTAEPLNIPLLEPFTIATGSVSQAQNVLITITLDDGSIGYGECAPFTPSTGETQETAIAAARGCAKLIEGEDDLASRCFLACLTKSESKPFSREALLPIFHIVVQQTAYSKRFWTQRLLSSIKKTPCQRDR
jgi:Mandelate racemase / muconate lactonizing enzyme, N-terminal domain